MEPFNDVESVCFNKKGEKEMTTFDLGGDVFDGF